MGQPYRQQIEESARRANLFAEEAERLMTGEPSAHGVDCARVLIELAHFYNLQAQTTIMAASLDG